MELIKGKTYMVRDLEAEPDGVFWPCKFVGSRRQDGQTVYSFNGSLGPMNVKGARLGDDVMEFISQQLGGSLIMRRYRIAIGQSHEILGLGGVDEL